MIRPRHARIVGLLLWSGAVWAAGPEPPAPALDDFEPGVRQALSEGLDRFRARAAADDAASLGVAWGELGMVYQAHHLQTLARQCYLQAVALQPQEFRWHYLLAYVYQETGAFEDALASYDRAVAIDPDYLPARLRRGQVYLDLRRLDAARADFEAVLAGRPDQPAALAGLGGIALDARDYPAAIRYFEQALAADPGADRLRHPLAMAYRQTGQVEQARRNLAGKGNTDPAIADPVLAEMSSLSRSAQYYLERGYAAARAGRDAESLEAFRRAVEYNPDDPAARVSLGQGLLQSGQTSAAREQFERALEIDPGYGPARYRRGTLREESGDDAGAIEDYQAALAADPGYLLAALRLGHGLMRLGRYGEAAEAYDSVVPPPDQVVIFSYRAGLAALAAGDCPRAMDQLERALAAQPGSGEVMQALARAYSSCPDVEPEQLALAADYAAIIYRARPDFDHAEALAMAAAANGRWQQALQIQSRLAEVAGEGDGPRARRARDLLEAYRQRRTAAEAWSPDHAVYRPAAAGAGREAPVGR
jgi:tetratricopeptide (TPR) repeat protein